MGEKIVVGPINKGLRTDRTPFVIDNDSFPTLINAYQWRGRVKRKRGTSLLGRLNRDIGVTDGSGNATITINPHPISSTVSQFIVGTNIFSDPGGASPVTLISTGPGTATLNRSTGVLTITGSNAATRVLYYPGLPVMGLEDLVLSAAQFPATLAFDTTYSYNISTSSPYSIYDVSFYKNPATATYTGYTAKGTWTPVSWNGQDYQQFGSTNYQGAFWETNGITVPFSTANIGMQFKPIVTVDNITGGPPAFADLTITAHGLSVGDFLFINEVSSTTGINFQTGYVTAVVNANKVRVEFPNATIATNGSGGIAQYLTNRSDTTKDCLRWYDGDPTGGTPPSPSSSLGWVNFMPPLSQGSFSIDDNPALQYYLVGAIAVIPYKDRLLFFGPVIQTSSGSPIYLQDAVVYSQNGTPFYTASFAYSSATPPAISSLTFNPILVPSNQTAQPSAYWEDQTGFGGFIAAGYAQPIVTVNNNEDVLLVGFTNRFARFVYTGNDIVPFNFFIINSELGAGSTYSSITLDRGAITIGNYGIALTTQVSSQRIDLEIPDSIFEFNFTNNGALRVSAQRDYINEWIYFSYSSEEFSNNYPNQTLQFNYRDNSWAIFNECFTTYGRFRQVTGDTWATIGTKFGTWSAWNEPWNAGASNLLMPKVIGGNQQGFVLFRDEGTNEANSLFIQNISGSTVTSPNHCLNEGDYIVITGAQGTVSSLVNNKIFSVGPVGTNTFTLNPGLGSGGTYLGGGLIQRMYVPQIQTKQFPTAWAMSRKTRLGPQQYLLTTTANGQITLQIFLSQNASDPFNDGSIVPSISPDPTNASLVYSDVLYTCRESTNLGLTPANTNLQQLVPDQSQTWHRMNTSLIGDTVQIGFTLSDSQMRDTDFKSQFAEIELHSFVLDVTPSQMLA